MSKKTIVIISISILIIVGLFCLTVFILNGADVNYVGWETVQIDNMGSFKISQEWIVNREGNVFYITDTLSESGNDKTQLLGSIWKIGEDNDHSPPYKLLEDTEFLRHVMSVNYSNSAGYRIEEFNHSGEIESHYTINFWGNNIKAEFIVCSDLLDEKTVKKIAKSYKME